MREQAIPVAAADHEGVVFFINTCFEEEYGWFKDDLIGNFITKFIPPHIRNAHNIGFSRFLTTEQSHILEKEMSLPVYCKDGTIRDATHFITSKKIDGKWRFASLINPV